MPADRVEIDDQFVEAAKRLMKRCQRGVGGRAAIADAHDIMSEAYGTIGRLLEAHEQAKPK